MIDGTEKPQILSKFAKRAARYNEFGYKTSKAQFKRRILHVPNLIAILVD